VLRVATVVEGVCVTLDPDFDFISVATEYLNEEGYIEAGVRDFVQDRVNEGRDAVESTVRIPPKIESALDRVEREDFHIRADVEDSEQVLERLGKRLVLGLALAAGGISTAMLYSFQPTETVAIAIAAGLTAIVGFLLYRSFRKRRGIRAKPQFTRQSMREQDEQREQANGASGALGFGDAAVEGSGTTRDHATTADGSS
jgi:DNA-binding Lrp family transcriptional regulator